MNVTVQVYIEEEGEYLPSDRSVAPSLVTPAIKTPPPANFVLHVILITQDNTLYKRNIKYIYLYFARQEDI